MTSSTPVKVENRLLDEIVGKYESQGYSILRSPGMAELPAFLSAFRPDLIATSSADNVVVEVKNRSQLTQADYLTELSRVVNSEPGWRFELVVSPAPQTPIRDGGKDIGYEGARNYLEHTRELLTTEQHEAAALLAWAAAEAALREIARLHKVLLERDQSTFVMSTLFSLGLLDDKEYTILQEAFRHRNFLAHGYYPPSGQLGSTWALIDVTEELLQRNTERNAPKKSIYTPLSELLQESEATSITVSFDSLETLLNRKLPTSARSYRQWWDNSDNSRHVQAKSWLNIGWRISDLDLVAESVTFKKSE